MSEIHSSGLVSAAWEKLERLITKLHETSDDDLSAGLRMQIKALAADLQATGSVVPEQFPHRQWVQLYLPEIAPPPTYGAEPVAPSETPTRPAPESASPTNNAPETEGGALATQIEAAVSENGANDEQAIEAAEALLRKAKVLQMRGQKQEAFALIQEAARTAPKASSVLEALGDELLAQRKTKEAKAMYLQAHQADPKNVSVERKHAQMVFQTDVQTMDLSRYSDSEIMASSKSAAILSLFIPGLGQLVLGEIVKGLAYAFAGIGGWILAVQLGMLHLFASVAGRTPKEVHPAAFLCAAIAIICHIVASVDAKSRGTAVQKKKPSRPAPPSDLPFE